MKIECAIFNNDRTVGGDSMMDEKQSSRDGMSSGGMHLSTRGPDYYLIDVGQSEKWKRFMHLIVYILSQTYNATRLLHVFAF